MGKCELSDSFTSGAELLPLKLTELLPLK